MERAGAVSRSLGRSEASADPYVHSTEFQPEYPSRIGGFQAQPQLQKYWTKSDFVKVLSF